MKLTLLVHKYRNEIPANLLWRLISYLILLQVFQVGNTFFTKNFQCFFLCQDTCVYAKTTANSLCMLWKLIQVSLKKWRMTWVFNIWPAKKIPFELIHFHCLLFWSSSFSQSHWFMGMITYRFRTKWIRKEILAIFKLLRKYRRKCFLLDLFYTIY